jgi:hypothetical protein
MDRARGAFAAGVTFDAWSAWGALVFDAQLFVTVMARSAADHGMEL